MIDYGVPLYIKQCANTNSCTATNLNMLFCITDKSVKYMYTLECDEVSFTVCMPYMECLSTRLFVRKYRHGTETIFKRSMNCTLQMCQQDGQTYVGSISSKFKSNPKNYTLHFPISEKRVGRVTCTYSTHAHRKN